jgi:putative copper resistance protein D
MVDWLAVARIAQFGSSIVAGGGAIFVASVGGGGRPPEEGRRSLAREIDGTLIAALLAAIVSGALWLCLVRSQLAQALADDETQVTLWSVITDTQFGRVSALRFLIALLLIVLCWVRFARPLPRSQVLDWSGAVLGLALVVSLAWCGHAGSGMGAGGDTHLAADAVHLAAAAI